MVNFIQLEKIIVWEHLPKGFVTLAVRPNIYFIITPIQNQKSQTLLAYQKNASFINIFVKNTMGSLLQN
jgi:hypothetical protein